MGKQLFFRGLFCIFMLSFFCSCRHPTAFDPTEKDKLTAQEEKELLDSARLCIIENSHLTVNAYERRKIQTTAPVSCRIHYMRRKYGRVSILWAFPADRQILAIYQGPLLLKDQDKPCWQVRVVTGRVRGSMDPALLGL